MVITALFAFLAFRTPTPVNVTVSQPTQASDELGGSGTGPTVFQAYNFREGAYFGNNADLQITRDGGLSIGGGTDKVTDRFCKTFTWNPPVLSNTTAASSTASTSIAWTNTSHLPTVDKTSFCTWSSNASSSAIYDCNTTANDSLTASTTIYLSSPDVKDYGELLGKACFTKIE